MYVEIKGYTFSFLSAINIHRLNFFLKLAKAFKKFSLTWNSLALCTIVGYHLIKVYRKIQGNALIFTTKGAKIALSVSLVNLVRKFKQRSVITNLFICMDM